jgi:hypothetical protein
MYNLGMRGIHHSLFIISSTLVTCLLLAACTSGPAKSISTLPAASETPVIASAIPSATAELPQPTATASPTDTEFPQPTPIIVIQPTTTIPTELATDLLDQKFPIAQLNIFNPGPNSKISSLIKISAYALPGANGKVTLQLWGEDGHLMAEQLIKLTENSGWITFTSQIPFEITDAGESAVLTLTAFDGYKRRMAVTSVPIILMQMGDSAIENGGFAKEPFFVQSPSGSSTISGGKLHIEGYAHPFSSAPLIVELIKASGGIVAARQVSLTALASGQDYAPFSIDIDYSVSQSTPIRRQGSDQAPFVDLALSSEVITLNP